jgi:N-methylhydantoinase A
LSNRVYRIGIDVGGTFTKAALIDDATHEIVARASVHTTHEHNQGVAAGVIQVFQKVLSDAHVAPSDVAFLAHSTTQATNALLEGDVARVGVIGMAGAQAEKLAAKQASIDPIELAPGRILQTSNCFLLSDGLCHHGVREAVQALINDGAQVLVASAAFGVDDTSSEELVREVGEQFGLPTTCGYEITKLYGLATRTRTAVINASILPRMIETARMTERSVREAGIDAPLMIMRSDGGVMDIHEMHRRPVMTMLSGPAASVAGALMHSRISDGIYFEVGGTSTNMGIVKSGRPTLAYAQVGGHNTFVNSLDVRVLGVAGGSLIQIDNGQVGDVGPRSAHIAGLRYACFADPRKFRGARATLFEPKPGDGAGYVVIDTPEDGQFALTATCAANALGLPTKDMHCYAPPEAAVAAFAPLAELLNSDVRSVAEAVLSKVADKVSPTVESLTKEYNLDNDQRIFIGEGGGVGAILPFLADRLGMQYEIARDAEIISSIGAALAMVREVVERIKPDATPEDVSALRAEAIEAAARLGAERNTIDVSIESDRHTGRIRAIATGVAALKAGRERRTISESAALGIAARSFRRPSSAIRLAERTPGAFVYLLDIDSVARSVRVVDLEGNIRIQRNHAVVVAAACEGWENAWKEVSRLSADRSFAGAILLHGKHIVDLTGIDVIDRATDVVRAELADVEPTARVAFIGFNAIAAA